MSPRALWLPVIALAAVSGVLTGMWRGGHFDPPPSPTIAGQAPTGVVEGDRLPDELVLTSLDGSPMPLSAFRGRPLLVNVWASWCSPCVEEMPELAAFYREQGDNGIQVIGLALDTPEAIVSFLSRVPVQYPIALDQPGPADASVALGNERGLLPYSVLIDEHGIVIKRKLGPFKHGEIADWASNTN